MARGASTSVPQSIRPVSQIAAVLFLSLAMLLSFSALTITCIIANPAAVVYCTDRDPSAYSGVSLRESSFPPANRKLVQPTALLISFSNPLNNISLQYEIELFAQVTQVLGWEPSMMNWTCMAWDDMLASLASGDGQCDIAVAGVSVLPENIDQGISFSRPTYRYVARSSSAPCFSFSPSPSLRCICR